MKLNYRSMGSGQPIIILHGVFGTSDNWQSFGKLLAEDYEVYLVDQRNHGLSPHSDDFSYPLMAEDLHEFIEAHQLKNPIILGHSMGGKVGMFFAVAYPDVFDKLVVVDIAPRAYPVHHQQILDALAAVKIGEIQSRKEAEEQMKPFIKDFGIRQFLLKNLRRTEDNKGFTWKLNLEAISNNIEHIGAAVDDSREINKPALFVRGSKSQYIRAEDEQLIAKIFPSAQVATIEDAGHWVHAEQPDRLYDKVMRFLRD